jgi:hypothetical protein
MLSTKVRAQRSRIVAAIKVREKKTIFLEAALNRQHTHTKKHFYQC